MMADPQQGWGKETWWGSGSSLDEGDTVWSDGGRAGKGPFLGDPRLRKDTWSQL